MSDPDLAKEIISGLAAALAANHPDTNIINLKSQLKFHAEPQRG